MRIVTEGPKTPPVLTGLISIDTSAPYVALELVPGRIYTGVLDLYDIDGVIRQHYFSSFLVRSDDAGNSLTGLEPYFPITYTSGGVSVRYILMTTLVIEHDTGVTEVRIPSYQKSVQYTVDGTNILASTAIINSISEDNYYSTNCARICLSDGSSDNFMFNVINPPFVYQGSTNTSVYTNVTIGGIVGQKVIFNFKTFVFDADVVALISTTNTLKLAGEVELIGLGSSISLLDDTMLLN